MSLEDRLGDSLYELDWVEMSTPTLRYGSRPHLAVLGSDIGWRLSGIEIESYPDVPALEQAIEQGSPAPDAVLLRAAGAMLQPTAAIAETSDANGDDLAERFVGSPRACSGPCRHGAASERLAEARLLVVTDRAVAVTSDEAPNLAQAALLGLLRSAQAEHPGRFGLIDLCDEDTSLDTLYKALASEEPELAIRRGALRAPRLARAKAGADVSPPRAPDPDGTVLITGGTGGLGALMACHLAREFGVKRLLLASRGGARRRARAISRPSCKRSAVT